MEKQRRYIGCFYHQTAFRAALSEEVRKEPPEREQIADLTFRDGRIVAAKERREKIHGKLLRASEQELEIEDYGVYQIAEEMEIYRLYGSLKTLEQAELRVAESPQGDAVRFRLILEKTDVARIIGRNGMTASAIRSLAKAAGEKHGIKVIVHMLSHEEAAEQP